MRRYARLVYWEKLQRILSVRSARPEGGVIMERLTTRGYGKSSLIKGMPICDIEEALDRLAAIEDILGEEYDLDELSKDMVALRREQDG